jgi:hypothetical protein
MRALITEFGLRVPSWCVALNAELVRKLEELDTQLAVLANTHPRTPTR